MICVCVCVCQPGAVIRWWTSTAAVLSVCPTWHIQSSTSQHTLLHSASRSRCIHTHTHTVMKFQFHLDNTFDLVYDDALPPETQPQFQKSVNHSHPDKLSGKQEITWVWLWVLLSFCFRVCCGFSLNVASCRPPNMSAKTSSPKCAASACTNSAR